MMLSFVTGRPVKLATWLLILCLALAAVDRSQGQHVMDAVVDENLEMVDATDRQGMTMPAMSATIVSCRGCQLNKHPVVKNFLTMGDMESYENVEIKWVSGKQPVMTTFLRGEKQEEIDLRKFDSTEKLHALMKEKGFVVRSEEELQAMRQKAAKLEKQQEAERRKQALARDERLRKRELEIQKQIEKEKKEFGFSVTERKRQELEDRKRERTHRGLPGSVDVTKQAMDLKERKIQEMQKKLEDRKLQMEERMQEKIRREKEMHGHSRIEERLKGRDMSRENKDGQPLKRDERQDPKTEKLKGYSVSKDIQQQKAMYDFSTSEKLLAEQKQTQNQNQNISAHTTGEL